MHSFRHRLLRSTLTASALTCALATGCGGPLEDEPTPQASGEELSSRQDPSYILTTSAWTLSGGVATIPVCWETSGSDTEKGWMRTIVESSYENRPFFHVDFTGWGLCNFFSTGIRIQISDTGPHVKALGRNLNGMANGMVLNVSFNNWSYGGCNTAVVGEAGRRDCIEDIAMHEFGHALGLAHEQNRDDKPGSCTDSPQGTNGDMFVGNFDQSSLMAYCNPQWNNDGFLSTGDVAGLARLYGAGGDVFVGTSTGAGFSSGAARHDWFCANNETCLTGDFNGDGREDLATFTHGTSADVYVTLSTGSGFSGTGWKWHDAFAANDAVPAVGDFNGDGRDDIAYFTRGTTGDVYVALSSGSAFGASVLWHSSFCYNSELPRVGDFNNDGRDDIATFLRGTSGDVYVALSSGAGFGAGVLWHSNFCYGTELPEVGDFNGDGRDDVVTFTRGTLGDVYVALSTGSAFSGDAWKWHDAFVFNSEIPAVGDVNGDGRDDIIAFARGTRGLVYAATSTGAAFSGTGWLWSTGLCLDQDECRVADVTGDGRADALGFKRN